MKKTIAIMGYCIAFNAWGSSFFEVDHPESSLSQQLSAVSLIEQKEKTKKQKNDHRHDNMREELMYRHEKSVRFKTSDLDKKA